MSRLIPLAFAFCAALSAAEPQVIELWPDGAPGSENNRSEEKWVDRTETILDRAVSNVHRPSLTVYLPKEGSATGTGVLVAPGGGYRHLAIDKEGHDIGRWLASIGVAGFVLQYRLPHTDGAGYDRATPLADAAQALTLIRQRAEDWGVEDGRLGMMGFSAGGDLCIRAGLELDNAPDFIAPIYPSTPKDLAVTADSPTAFLVHADDDRLSSDNSIRLYQALKEAGVPAELHIYSKGGHGFGIRQRGLPVSAWRDRFVDWLRLNELLPR